MRGQNAQKLFLSQKVANAILRASSTTWTIILSNEMNSFCNAEDRFHLLSFFAEKVILELMHKITSWASKTPILCLVQTKQLWECEAKMLKAHFSVRKSTKCNFKSKDSTT